MMPEPSLFRTILCPVDFSIHSRQALAYAALVARKTNSRLVTLFVEDPLAASVAAIAHDDKRLIERSRLELRRLVERMINPFRLPLNSVTIDVAVGRPHHVIARTADTLKCDLIVMGAHGRTGVNKLMIGSTTHRLLRDSPVAILATPPVMKGRAARPPRSWPGKRAIAPVDFGPRVRADVLAAATAARDIGIQLELVHVVEPITDVPWLELDEERRNMQQQRLAVARLTRLQDDWHDIIPAVRVESGKPAQVIADIASASHVGMVVMTRRHGRGLFGPRQGSISYEVLWRSNIPVLALPSGTRWLRHVVRRAR